MSRLTPGQSYSMSAMPKAPARRATAARIWSVFDPSARSWLIAVEHLVELEDEVHRKGDVGMRFVNQLQRVAIAGDLLFRAVARLRPADDEIGDASWRRGHTLDAVGRFSGLDNGAGPKFLELFRELADEQVLAAACLSEPVPP